MSSATVKLRMLKQSANAVPISATDLESPTVSSFTQERKIELPRVSVFVPSSVGKVKLVMPVLENAKLSILIRFE